VEFSRGLAPEETLLELTELEQYSTVEADPTSQLLADFGSPEVWHQSTLPGFRTFSENLTVNLVIFWRNLSSRLPESKEPVERSLWKG
jgi:hypothetical protein